MQIYLMHIHHVHRTLLLSQNTNLSLLQITVLIQIRTFMETQRKFPPMR